MNWHNRLGLWRNGGLDFVGVDCVIARMNIHQNGSSPGDNYRGDGGKCCMRNRDDLVASTNAKRSKRQSNCIGAASQSDSVLCAVIVREFGLECFDI